jgi:DNA gyrase subunit B
VTDPTSRWRNTTHDWTSTVDVEHLAEIRDNPARFAPGGLLHLVLEVVAYAADEAASTGGGHGRVTLHADGSVSVADDGRGTDTRHDASGNPIRKPVMATKDLRFFDTTPAAQQLADGHPRRGMSVVAALSDWLVHTNRRSDGAWTQRYEHGLPVTDLVPIDGDHTTGTTVHFMPGRTVPTTARPSASELSRLARWPHLSVEVVDQTR